MMAEKREKKEKKSPCSNDGDFGLRGRRFWRDENDGDSVPMTESWQVCIAIYSHRLVCGLLSKPMHGLSCTLTCSCVTDVWSLAVVSLSLTYGHL